MKRDLKPQASFPVLIKLLAVFFILGFLPMVIISMVFLWDYNAMLKIASSSIGENPAQIMEKIQQAQYVSRIKTGFMFIVFMASLIGGVLFSARILVRPLSQILDGIHLLIGGQYGAEIKTTSSDEYGIAADYFNKMSRQLKTMIEREKMISKMKSEFITLAAHQLRTPLATVKWTLRMLVDGDLGKLNQEQKNILEDGYQANEKIIQLTSDLLDVVKIEEGKFDYNFDYANPGEIIDKTIDEQKFMAGKKKIKIAFQKPKGVLPKIKLDVQKIKLAFGNLLTNAINYTLPGGLIEIIIGYQDENYLKIQVKDSGVGIPKSQMPRLFSKFFRSENAMRIQPDGSGLGLFIAKNIVNGHGGKIWIESEEGKGTSVYFTLPLSEKLLPPKPEAFDRFIIGA